MGVVVKERIKGSGEWWIFINHHGKRKSKKIGKDKRLAKDAAKQIELKLALGDLRIENIGQDSIPTFQEYASKMLALPSDRKQSTIENYEKVLRLHVNPLIGDQRLDKIPRKHIKTLLDDLLIKGLKPSVVMSIKNIISAVFSSAVDTEVIPSNPVTGLKFKHKRENKVDPLSEDEAERLLSTAKDYLNGKYHTAFLTLLRTGLRVGELFALTWKDILFDKKLIDVNKTRDPKGRTTTPKTARSKRKVDMSSGTVEAIRALKKAQWKTAATTGEPVPERIFPFKRTTFCKALNVCLGKAELKKIRVHSLRHSYATIRLLKGHNIGDVSYQLGHASI